MHIILLPWALIDDVIKQLGENRIHSSYETGRM